ncbi:MAG: metal-dependent transcriptional regulator [Thiotrichales bacterium]|nr:metal-dependent transcriptional regulator [Thiotrichales bacterium]
MASITVENYLRQIYKEQERLGPEEHLVPVGHVAATMGVAPGTATSMVKTLADAKLLRYEPRRGVWLTESGTKLALQVVRRHRLAELFLVEVLGLDWSEVDAEAEELEHAISDKVLARIDAYLGYPTVDPHGHPIPPPTGRPLRQEFTPLTDCPTDVPLRVAQVLDEDPDFLRYAGDHGLMPGQRIVVAPRQPATDAVTLSTADRKSITLGATAAAKILVEFADEDRSSMH